MCDIEKSLEYDFESGNDLADIFPEEELNSFEDDNVLSLLTDVKASILSLTHKVNELKSINASLKRKCNTLTSIICRLKQLSNKESGNIGSNIGIKKVKKIKSSYPTLNSNLNKYSKRK